MPYPYKKVAPKICERCGVEFARHPRRSPFQFFRTRFCSPRCCRENERERHAAKRLAALAPCLHCGKPKALLKPSHAVRRRFCSTRCHGEWTKARTEERMSALKAERKREQPVRAPRPLRIKPSTCPSCGAQFVVFGSRRLGRPYCSYACARANRKRPKMLKVKCVNCKKEFQRTTAAVARVKATFCSSACSHAYLREERHHNYRGGHDPNRGPKWIRLAETIRNRDGYKCGRCGRSQDENGEKLSVDHIRPWRSFTDKTEANATTNLISLCRPCHAVKTSRVENKMRRGDMLDFAAYQRAIAMPSVVTNV